MNEKPSLNDWNIPPADANFRPDLTSKYLAQNSTTSVGWARITSRDKSFRISGNPLGIVYWSRLLLSEVITMIKKRNEFWWSLFDLTASIWELVCVPLRRKSKACLKIEIHIMALLLSLRVSLKIRFDVGARNLNRGSKWTPVFWSNHHNFL